MMMYQTYLHHMGVNWDMVAKAEKWLEKPQGNLLPSGT